MKLSLRHTAEIDRMKSEIAYQYGVKDIEDITPEMIRYKKVNSRGE